MEKPRNILPKRETSDSPNPESVPSAPEASTKRRCISSACMPCRKRKSKCDGGQPTCNACLTVYSTQCYYDLDSDHRRKGALKRDIAQLKEELGAQATILDALKRAGDADIDDIVNLLRTNPDESYESIAESVQRMTLNAKQKQPNNVSPAAASGLEGELAKLAAETAMTKNTGDPRHYGHTSNLAFYRTSADTRDSAGDQIETWTTVTSDMSLIQHLLDLYFTWSHPWYLLFSEEVFYHGFQDRKRRYCTPLLVNAILALACNFSNRPEARADPNDPATRGNHFFAEAKRLLYEDDRSSLPTVQALGLMSLRAAMNNYDSPGGQYASQMMGMAIQLGLHMQSAVDSNMTATEIEARRVTFWGIYILETFWAVCVGRLSTLPGAAIRLERPKIVPYMEDTPWKPHGMPNYDGSNPSLQQASHKYSMLVQSSLLAEILDEITRMFYAPRDRITSRRLQHHHAKLQGWYDNLPYTLRIKEHEPTLPQVFCLHMYYHNCVIHLFRPFIKVSFIQNVKPPRQICTEAANMITRLMNQYFDIYGSKYSIFLMSHCIVSAGIIHLVNLSSPTTKVSPGVQEQAEMSLVSSMRWLVAPQVTFPLVERYLMTLVTLTHKWFTTIPPQIQEALQQVGGGSHARTIEKIAMDTRQPHPSWTVTQTNNNTFVRPPPPSSSGPPSNISFHPASRKHSVTGLVQMAPPSLQATPLYSNLAPNSQLISPTSHNPPHSQFLQHVYWTPFPESFDGIPLPLLDHSNQMAQQQLAPTNAMSVTGMLAGEIPALSQDGFMLESEHHGHYQQRNGNVNGVQHGQAGVSWNEWRGSMNGT